MPKSLIMLNYWFVSLIKSEKILKLENIQEFLKF